MTYNNKEATQAQIKFCGSNNTPLFAPRTGVCWACHRNIYEHISVKKAGSELITSCPLCNRSFVS